MHHSQGDITLLAIFSHFKQFTTQISPLLDFRSFFEHIFEHIHALLLGLSWKTKINRPKDLRGVLLASAFPILVSLCYLLKLTKTGLLVKSQMKKMKALIILIWDFKVDWIAIWTAFLFLWSKVFIFLKCSKQHLCY